jgi:hypothetical protein
MSPQRINTETSLDYDYHSLKESYDTDTVRDYLKEYNKITGLRCNYYHLHDAGLQMDPVFLEKSTKRFEYPIEVKFVFAYLEEVIENISSGIELLDTVELTCEMSYFREETKFEKPLIGSLIYIPYAELWFSVENVVDSDAILFGSKLTWKLTAKIYQEAGEDKDITNEVYDAGEAPGESDNFMEQQNDAIEELSEEQHVYDGSDNIFGEY